MKVAVELLLELYEGVRWFGKIPWWMRLPFICQDGRKEDEAVIGHEQRRQIMESLLRPGETSMRHCKEKECQTPSGISRGGTILQIEIRA